MTIDTYRSATTSKIALSQQREMQLRPGLAFLSIAAILSLGVETELLEHVDSLSRYMTSRQIALEGGIALLGGLSVGLAWWLGVLLLANAAKVVSRAKRRSVALFWNLWLSAPLSYFVLSLFRALLIQLFPHWHPGLLTWVICSAILIVMCVACLAVVSLARLQEFCRHRLAPLGWLHVILSLAAWVTLWAKDLPLYQDYVHPGRALAASDLPDIYLITMDALRAEDMSVYGYNLPTTPNLERFAEHSSTFEYFIANANFTAPATTSVETGTLPWSHGVFQLDGFLRSGERESLPALLRQQGYYTAMVTSNDRAGPFHHGTLHSYDAVAYDAPYGALGVGRYLHFIGTNSETTLASTLLGHLTASWAGLDPRLWDHRYPSLAEPVFDRARALLEHRDTTQPVFLWAHILPPHQPYWPPAPYDTRFLSAEKLAPYADFSWDSHALPRGMSASELRTRYDEMVLYADHAVGDFLEWLDRTGRLDRSIVIVSADHGESFEHNWFSHAGPHLYTGLIHIPLLIHLPGQKQGARISYLGQQADLLPTILDLVGGPVPSRTDGVSLRPVLQGKPLPQRYVFSMNLEPNRVFDPITKGTVAVLDDEFKYVNYLDHHQEALYRYKSDPVEGHNLINAEPQVATRMRDALSEKLKEVNRQFASKP